MASHPSDRQSASANASPSDPDLRVTVGSLTLKNPVIAASGTFGYGIEFAHLVDLNRLGGICVKGLSREPMAGAPAPRMCDTAGGMMNAIGLQNVGVRAFVADKLPKLRQFDTAILANVFGNCVSDYVEVIRALEDAEGIAAYELNISCPNTASGGIEFGLDPIQAAQVVAAAREASQKRPLWVKLSPAIGVIREVALACEAAGADALVIANTYPALSLDGHSRKSYLGNTTGGLSGPAIKPITMRLVYDAAKVIQIPIVGLGGIERVTDIAEYLIAGATAVEVGTAHFIDPRASEKLVVALGAWCQEQNVVQISSLRGTLQS